jgi:hypothetical protein
MSPLQKPSGSFSEKGFAGAENAVPRSATLTRFIRHQELPDRDCRDRVGSQLVTVFKKPICTSPAKGYFVARTERDQQDALNYLDSV